LFGFGDVLKLRFYFVFTSYNERCHCDDGGDGEGEGSSQNRYTIFHSIFSPQTQPLHLDAISQAATLRYQKAGRTSYLP
jgi:hypothetical protein